MRQTEEEEKLVYGLDIGTRSIVGTVGYKTGERAFTVVAQCTRLHETRAMMDGQIHDITSVANTISQITGELEKQTGKKLKEVCIAAAGRVLKTARTFAEVEFDEEVVVDEEIVHSLEMLGVEKAHRKVKEDTKEEGHHFFCVAYTVVHYYLNGFIITNLEEHKASKIGVEVLATFLPDEVIDGLYAAVGKAGLSVENLTLEPIAAMLVAIPENYRLLNIALVDVGAGTSDICITRDGTVAGYGMIPMAGDKLTEAIAKKRLVDYNNAERMKLETSTKKKTITYTDIMGIKQKADREDIVGDIAACVEEMAHAIAGQIMELNGGKPVSAVFVVGGGGKIEGFLERLSEELAVPRERVALRGEEVLSFVTFLQEGIKKDSLLVTPIGICLNYYEQRNNFIFVRVNEERIKLYDNGTLTVADAAMQYGYPNEKLFPTRGKELHFTVNKEKRTIKGKPGEAAEITLNGEQAGMNTAIVQNDRIKIMEATRGADASCTVGSLQELKQAFSFTVNGNKVMVPRPVWVNGEKVSEYYELKEEDDLSIPECDTLEQVLAYLDIVPQGKVYVNGEVAEPQTKVFDGAVIRLESVTEEKALTKEPYVMSYEDYENEEERIEDEQPERKSSPLQQEKGQKAVQLMSLLSALNAEESSLKFGKSMSMQYAPIKTGQPLPPLKPFVAEQQEAEKGQPQVQTVSAESEAPAKPSEEEQPTEKQKDIVVLVNNQPKLLTGKSSYLLVDVLDVVTFNLADGKGREAVVQVNGVSTTFIQPIADGDRIDLYWKEKNR